MDIASVCVGMGIVVCLFFAIRHIRRHGACGRACNGACNGACKGVCNGVCKGGV